ncbi:class F sortase [Streptomyces sp. NPDC097619]|uniref:class F sortase n=1 Tax=Streptomyces sp. NPDC097619 TaxID=3157228 RepID=UPI00332936D5
MKHGTVTGGHGAQAPLGPLGGGRGDRPAAAAAVLSVLLAVLVTVGGPEGTSARPPGAGPEGDARAPAAVPAGAVPGPGAGGGTAARPAAVPRRTGAPLGPGPAAPVRLVVPELGVDAAVVPLPAGPPGGPARAAPSAPDTVGWYLPGAGPVATGTAVLLGRGGPGAGPDRPPGPFHRLALLRPGDPIRILRADGRTAVFLVRTVGVSRTGPGRDRPPAAGRSGGPAELRLVACDGWPSAWLRKTGPRGRASVLADLAPAGYRP